MPSFVAPPQSAPTTTCRQCRLAQGDFQVAGSGGNTAPDIEAPAGIRFATPKTIASFAAATIDTLAQQHVWMTPHHHF
jgi:uncharacterized protein (DUF2345 family)